MESRRYVWTRENKLKHAPKFSSADMCSWRLMNPVVHRTDALRKSPLNLLISCKKPWDFRVTKTWGHFFFSFFVNSITLKQTSLRVWCTATYSCHINLQSHVLVQLKPWKAAKQMLRGFSSTNFWMSDALWLCSNSSDFIKFSTEHLILLFFWSQLKVSLISEKAY